MRLVADGRVSVLWQTVFAVIPFVDLYAFHRIQKLRLLILLVYVPAIIINTMVSFVFLFDGSEFEITLIDTGSSVVFFGLAAFLMYRWAKAWNVKFPQAGNIK